MDFNDTAEEAAFRKEVRTWLEANATRKSDDKQSFRARNDDPELLKKAKEWQDKKAKAGYARITWPQEFGGRGASPTGTRTPSATSSMALAMGMWSTPARRSTQP